MSTAAEQLWEAYWRNLAPSQRKEAFIVPALNLATKVLDKTGLPRALGRGVVGGGKWLVEKGLSAGGALGGLGGRAAHRVLAGKAPIDPKTVSPETLFAIAQKKLDAYNARKQLIDSWSPRIGKLTAGAGMFFGAPRAVTQGAKSIWNHMTAPRDDGWGAGKDW